MAAIPPPPPPSASDSAPSGPGSQQQPPQGPPPGPPQEPPLPDPGPWDMLHREAKGVLTYPAQFFDGARISFNRGVSQNMQVSHVLNLGGNEKGYSFSPTYVGTQTLPDSPQTYPVVLGSVDNSGNLVAQLVHQPTPKVNLKFNGQSQGSVWMGAQVEAGYKGSDFTTGITVAKSSNMFIYVTNYLQKLSNNFSMGAEFMVQSANQMLGPGLSFAGRYRTDKWVATGTLIPSAKSVQATYFHKLDQTTHVATEVQLDGARGEAIGSLGYQYNFRTAIFRGQLNTHGVVAGSLEQDIFPGVLGIQLQGELDHFSGESKFGIGLVFNN